MRVEMMLKDVGAKENSVRTQIAWKYSLTHPKTK
jgi:hypothetical protein